MEVRHDGTPMGAGGDAAGGCVPAASRSRRVWWGNRPKALGDRRKMTATGR
jgi:hypothetical protein